MRNWLPFFDLHTGEDQKDRVLENVKSGISFRGANAWILACAIVIASVGLNVNSTAVIIGAMLISPLMGPILGAGFALGTFDFPLLKKSMKNLLIATCISLFVSFIYFLLSPFKEAQSELLARTSPNIYDVLIAFFGGLVGVVAITRVDKGNPIPGVAIATALMPPLCTAGYGLAIGNFSYFAGALYLYIINCVFICLSTFVIVKYLRYPRVRFVDPSREKRISQSISILTVVLIAPSLYFAYILYEERKYINQVDTFLQAEFIRKGYTIIYQNTRFNTQPKELELAFLDKKFDPKEIEALHASLPYYGLSNTSLLIRQDSVDLNSTIRREIDRYTTNMTEKDYSMRLVNQRLARFELLKPELHHDLQVLFPEISSYSIGMQQYYPKPDSLGYQIAFLYQIKTKLSEEERLKLQKWLQGKYPNEKIEMVLTSTD
jgi:uncharacterized hydrophobic protein (TIGR00271 family)